MKDAEFFLASNESYEIEAPRGCRRIKRIRTDARDDLLLVKVDPPLIGQSYGLGSRDIHVLLLAPRHAGVSLFPILQWPVHVYVARLLVDDPERREQLHPSEYASIAWGELYPSEREARRKTI